MITLLKKDILIQKRILLFCLVYVLIIPLFFRNFEDKNLIFSASIMIVTYMLLTNACALEEKNKTEVLYNSLPVSRTKIVAARYLSLFLYSAVASVYYLIISNLVTLLHLPLKIYPATLEGFFGGLITVIILNSIYLPVFFKMGFVKSRYVNLFLFFGVFFSITLVSQFAKAITNPVFIKLISLFKLPQGNLLITAGISALIMVISFFISCRIYNKKEF